MSADTFHEPWPAKDIAYTIIVGLIMLAAALEWFLWIAAFMYCLIKVFLKAEHWSINVLSAIVAILFLGFRGIFLPIMVVTLPLPSAFVRLWPEGLVTFLQWFAFWSFSGLLTIPWLFCVYHLVTHQLGRAKRVKEVLDEVSAPKVVIVMPVYKEDPDVLVVAINSVVDCDYPPSCIHVFLSFDGDQEDELYLNTIEKLGVPLTLESYPKSIDVTYKAARITISRFPHGGKRHCQKATFKLIDRVYREYLKKNDNLFILFIDSDCILDTVCLQNFVYDMELSPGNKRNMLAMTGVITSTTKKHSLITLLQDMEYIHGQLFERTVESGCGAVTCLPGALTMLRFSAFRRMAKYYFADKAEQCEDLFDFAKCHLGEDRWLTHLFMIGAKERHQIQMCTSAFCKTEAVQTYRSLIKQRRRWFLGFITNEVCMLTDWRLWKRYPILILVRFMQNTIRTTALLFFVLVLAILTTEKRVQDLPVGFIGISLGLNWLMMIYFGAKLGRYKLWAYPVMFILNPFFNWYYMVYGIFTAGQRTWGGPRADAAAADPGTSPQEAIEQAEATGDELNVVPETFMPATAARLGPNMGKVGGPVRPVSMVQPPDHVNGMFTARDQRTFGGGRPAAPQLYSHAEEELEEGAGGGVAESLIGGISAPTEGNSAYMPRRVESIMNDEDRRKYELAQQNQYNMYMAKLHNLKPTGPPSGPGLSAPPAQQQQQQQQQLYHHQYQDDYQHGQEHEGTSPYRDHPESDAGHHLAPPPGNHQSAWSVNTSTYSAAVPGARSQPHHHQQAQHYHRAGSPEFLLEPRQLASSGADAGYHGGGGSLVPPGGGGGAPRRRTGRSPVAARGRLVRSTTSETMGTEMEEMRSRPESGDLSPTIGVEPPYHHHV